jgi:alpha-beta hydrolase superfamily lysophospholipase
VKIAAARLAGRVIPWLPVKNDLKSEQLTRDEEMQRLVERDSLYNWTTTPRWFDEATAAQAQVRQRAAAITTPALVLVADEDPIARPQTSVDFFEALGSADKELRRYPGARHELFNELPATRQQAMQDVVDWIRARSS